MIRYFFAIKLQNLNAILLLFCSVIDMQGNPERKMPSLEKIFDDEINQVRQMMDNERKAIKEEVKRELMREGAVNEQTESN